MSEFQRENKFIVLNYKRLDEAGRDIAEPFIEALNTFTERYENEIGKLDQRYVVVNQDETYAEGVWKLIEANYDNA